MREAARSCCHVSVKKVVLSFYGLMDSSTESFLRQFTETQVLDVAVNTRMPMQGGRANMGPCGSESVLQFCAWNLS